jgi:hypothetical protein
MATKKQRRRREKLQRHEWELVEIDEEGNETPIEASEVTKAELKKKETNGKDRATRPRGARPIRVVKPPSWSRSAKRAGLFAPLLFVFLSIGKNPPPVAARLGIALLYAAVFVPMFFFVDRMAYRAYQRRVGGGS